MRDQTDSQEKNPDRMQGIHRPEDTATETAGIDSLDQQHPKHPWATMSLIVVNVGIAIYVGVSTGNLLSLDGQLTWVHRDFALFGPAVAAGEYERLITSGFLHFGIIHLLLNMVTLGWLGKILEPALGVRRFVTVYLLSLLGGSLGALVLDPYSYTAGASGAIFGLAGAILVIELTKHKKGDTTSSFGAREKSGIAGAIAINLIISSIDSGVSLGGHTGGLVLGILISGSWTTLSKWSPVQTASFDESPLRTLPDFAVGATFVATVFLTWMVVMPLPPFTASGTADAPRLRELDITLSTQAFDVLAPLSETEISCIQDIVGEQLIYESLYEPIRDLPDGFPYPSTCLTANNAVWYYVAIYSGRLGGLTYSTRNCLHNVIDSYRAVWQIGEDEPTFTDSFASDIWFILCLDDHEAYSLLGDTVAAGIPPSVLRCMANQLGGPGELVDRLVRGYDAMGLGMASSACGGPT